MIKRDITATQFFNQVSWEHGSTKKSCISPRIGYGSAIGHYGEVLQGVFVGTDGHTHRGLVTLPCELFVSSAKFTPASSITTVVEPASKIKSRRAAEVTLEKFGLTDWGGHLIIQSNIPESWGLGSSSSDVVATIRAVADAFGVKLAPITLAKLAVMAETASDSIMFENDAILFAQREGKIIENFHNCFPYLVCLGFNTDPTEAGVETLNFKPAEYDWREIEAFKVLRGLLRHAIHTQNPKLIGQVASASARMNQRYLPKPAFAELEELVNTVAALGLAVAHSGTAACLLFDPQDPNTVSRISKAQALLSQLGFGKICQFHTGYRGEVIV